MSLTDIYSRVTNKIIADLENGVRPWMKPWDAGNTEGRIMQPLRANGQAYKGINVILLWDQATEKGYTSPHWMTFKQANAMKASIRKGEHGSLVVFADKFKKTETNGEGQAVEKEIPYLKGYTVFNADQIDGLEERYTIKAVRQDEPMQLVEQAEMFFNGTGATVNHGGNRAFYVPSRDLIQMPKPEAFKDAESYEATKGHEMVHWTGHESRLARQIKNKHGDEDYAREELVAELGASFLCASLGITPEVREDHASYVASWLKVLKEDKKALFAAASQAQKAVDHLYEIQPQPFYP